MFLDTNVFVYAHFDAGEKGERARAVLESIVRGKQGYTSALVMDELLWILLRNKLDLAVIEEIYATRNLTVLPVSAQVPLRAVHIIRTKKLKPRDAFHVATMHEYDIKTIVSEDKDFDGVVKRHGF